MIIAKKSIFVSICILFFSSIIVTVEAESFQQKLPIQLSTDHSFGFLYGQAEEIVYRHENQDTYLSQLLWDIKPLMYLGLKADIDISLVQDWTLFFSTNGKFAIPMLTGHMEDRDWMAQDNELSHFSKSNTKIQSAVLLDASFGSSYTLNITDQHSLRFSLMGTVSIMNYSWRGFGGYYQYASGNSPWDSSLEKKYWKNEETVIDYSQNWVVMSPGIKIDYDFLKQFTLSIGFNISPSIKLTAVDNHVKTGVTWTDSPTGGLFTDTRFTFKWQALTNMNLQFNASYRNISGSRGNDSADAGSNIIEGPPDGHTDYGNISGAGYQAWDFSLGVGFFW